MKWSAGDCVPRNFDTFHSAYPTENITIQASLISVSELNKLSRSEDFEALNMRNVWSGTLTNSHACL